MENQKEKIRQYIIGASMATSVEIHDDALIFEQGFLDSMGLLFLVQFLNEEFQIAIADHDLVSEHFESINAIASFLEGRLGTQDVVKDQELQL